jgi:hypothetical protein
VVVGEQKSVVRFGLLQHNESLPGNIDLEDGNVLPDHGAGHALARQRCLRQTSTAQRLPVHYWIESLLAAQSARTLSFRRHWAKKRNVANVPFLVLRPDRLHSSTAAVIPD